MAPEYDSTAVCAKQNEEIPGREGGTNALFYRFEIKKRIVSRFILTYSARLYIFFFLFARERGLLFCDFEVFLNIELQLETINGISYIYRKYYVT